MTVFGRIPIAQKNNQKECHTMNDTKIASKAKAQLSNFMGKVFTHFSKPTKRFIEECIYGIQASGDTKLSSIVRAIDDDIRPIYTEKRRSRNLNNDKFSLLLMTDMQLHASDLLPKMRIHFGIILSLLI